MGDLQQVTQFVRIGRQSDRITACPFDVGDYEHPTDANRWRDFATAPDGLSGGVSNPNNPFPTQHKVRGALYFVKGPKNQNAGTLTLPMTPESMAFLFGLLTVTSDQLDHYTVEEYWTSALTGGDIGRQMIGCIFTSWGFSFDREQGGGMNLELGFFLNQEVAIAAGAIPDFTPAPALVGVYEGLGVLVDLVKTTGAFGTDLVAIRSGSLQFSHNVTVSDPRAHSTGSLDRVWTRHAIGEPTLTFTPVIRIDDDDYLEWPREEPLAQFQVRIALFKNSGTFNLADNTTVLIDAAGQTVLIDDATGLEDGDVVLITDGSKFTTNTVDNVTTGPDSMDLVEDADAAFAAENVQIYNCAAEIRIPRLELTAPGQKSAGTGGISQVSHGFTAALLAGETDLYSTRVYNDNNT